MLQPLMRMGYIPVQRDISFKKFFGFFDLPDTQPCRFVNRMLKKNRHRRNFRFEIGDFRFIIAKIMEAISFINK